MLFELIVLAVYSLFGHNTELISAIPDSTPAPVIQTLQPTPTNTTAVLGVALEPTASPTTPSANPTDHPIKSPTPKSTTSPTLNSTISPTPSLKPQPTEPSATPTATKKPLPTTTLLPKATASPSLKPITYTITGQQLDELFTKYAEQYKIDREQLRRIALCESKFNTNALNKKYGYGGLYQFSPASWSAYRKLMNQETDPNLRFNPEEAVETAAWMLSTGRSGAWPSCK